MINNNIRRIYADFKADEYDRYNFYVVVDDKDVRLNWLDMYDIARSVVHSVYRDLANFGDHRCATLLLEEKGYDENRLP